MIGYPWRVYNVDIVMCIDASGSMAPIIDEVKGIALSFHQKIVEAMELIDKDIEQLRIKVIAFRDYGCDEKPMEESKFYTLPDETEEFKNFVNSIEAKGGGNGPENALEAIALALKSDWTTGGSKQRHVILVFTDAPALSLGERSGAATYPGGLPTDLAMLTAWWEGTDQIIGSTYKPKYGRLVAFAPEDYPWAEMQSWNRYWPLFIRAGSGCLSFECAIDLIAGAV